MSQPICPICEKGEVIEIAKVAALQDYIGQDLEQAKVPLYLCKDCNKIINP